ncbi:sugar transferase [Nitrospinota bacterium]
MLKRAFDILFSAAALALLLPVLGVTAFFIKREDGGPVFYRGVRVGRHGKEFRIFKFRSMVMNADKIGGPSSSDDDPRITRAGKFIRKYKLDEIPQLLNVLKGEMSLVGPRPEVPEEVVKYTEEEKRLLSVLPGITDYASIKFHNEGEILKGSEDPHETYRRLIRPEKIRLGLQYVEERSFLKDLGIIMETAGILLGSRLKGNSGRGDA